MMKKNILIWFMLLFLTVFTGCNTKYGSVNLQTWNGISIYVDNTYKGNAGEGITKLKIEEGNHIIKISGDSKDGDWHYEIEKSVYVGADMEITVSLIPNKFPTEQRKNKDKIIQEKKDRAIQKKLDEAKQYGCSSIHEYKTYRTLNKEKEQLKISLKTINKLKKELVKKNGYMVPNDYIELSDFSIKDRKLIINIKNKTKNTITYFWTYFSLADENLKYIGGDKQYKEYITINPYQNKNFSMRLSTDIYRKIIKSKNIHLFMDVDSIRYRDNIGKVSKNLDDKGWSFSSKINKISNENIFQIKQKIKNKENKLLEICKKT